MEKPLSRSQALASKLMFTALSLLRAPLEARRYLTAATLRAYCNNRVARCAGIVTGRQRLLIKPFIRINWRFYQ